MRLALIGGTGVYDPEVLEGVRELSVETPYGLVHLLAGRFPGGEEVAFLARHGRHHSIPPHRVNYRANLWALKSLGVERVLATAAVGSLDRELAPGTFVLVNQFLDFTRGRPSTYFDREGDGVAHVDVSEPYCPELRALLEEEARGLGIPVRQGGVYVCTEGPRYETPAEIRAYRRLGGDVVGMTGVPEVVLARELGLCYAAVAMVTNLAAGIADHPLTHAEVNEVMERNGRRLRELLAATLGRIPAERARCGCAVTPEVYGR
ncbi:MAG: S-methyl-5'-thioadenosine phosphorylase [Firmicutes bacterium]|nr:S-methyl-5'-thioadenosine phosphorylase [Bacillota bacterium]